MGIPVPTPFLLKNSTLQGKDELIEAIQAEEQQQAALAEQKAHLDLAILQSQLQQNTAKTADYLAMARERVGRTKSNIGLFEERMSELTQNRAQAAKDKMSAIKEFLDTVKLYGEVQTMHASDKVDQIERSDEMEENKIKQEAKQPIEAP